jgi:hypothetical protein
VEMDTLLILVVAEVELEQ